MGVPHGLMGPTIIPPPKGYAINPPLRIPGDTKLPWRLGENTTLDAPSSAIINNATHEQKKNNRYFFITNKIIL
jgi:hypothetical protein